MKKRQVLAAVPPNFSWIDNFDDQEELSVIHAKLQSLGCIFSGYKPNNGQVINAYEIYGLWFMLRDICDTLARIIKIEHWPRRIGEEET